MFKFSSIITFLVIATAFLPFLQIPQAEALVPYTRPLWDSLFPLNLPDDPFKILEETPLSLSKGLENLALARADWKETANEHVITLDVPGMTKDEVKIEVEENRVLRISGERKKEEEKEGENWHRAERISGKFWRQFRLPANADLENIKASLDNGVIKISVPKLAEDKIKKQPRVISIAQEAKDAVEKIVKGKKDDM